MIPDKIQTNLEYREIIREEDKDYFIETLSYPINFETGISNMSRVQFPKSRAILIRTSPSTNKVTIHIMRDIDLYSSFANFELDLQDKRLRVDKKEGYIIVQLMGE